MNPSANRRLAILLASVVFLAGLIAYGFLLRRNASRLVVTIANRTGAPIDDVRVEKSPDFAAAGRIADGAESDFELPIGGPSGVTLSFRGTDGKTRSRVYHQGRPSGINNTLRIVLLPSIPGLRQTGRSALILGTETTFEDSPGRIDEESRERERSKEVGSTPG